MSTHLITSDGPRRPRGQWVPWAAAAVLLLACLGSWRLSAARSAWSAPTSRRVKILAKQQWEFHVIGGPSAAYADVVYPIEARPDYGAHLSADDLRKLLAGIDGPAHELVRNDAFNILDRAARAHALPAAAHQAILRAAVLGLQAGGHDQLLVRASAATFLGDFGDGAAVKPLMPLLRDPEELVRTRARLALKKLGFGRP